MWFITQFIRIIASVHSIRIKTIKSDYVVTKYVDETLFSPSLLKKNHQITLILWWTTNVICCVRARVCTWWVHTKCTPSYYHNDNDNDNHGQCTNMNLVCVRVRFCACMSVSLSILLSIHTWNHGPLDFAVFSFEIDNVCFFHVLFFDQGFINIWCVLQSW